MLLERASKMPSVVDEILADKKLANIFEKLDSVCPGEMVRTSRGMGSFAYAENNQKAKINVSNISAGLKTFAIIKTLILNGNLKEGGVLILDEPEIHLHPDWQLVFAELIVLIQKEFAMHILLNTHSPYFLKAIEVYADKHGIGEKCKFYLAENEGEVASIRDVSGEVEQIFEKFARPLQELENERYADA